MDILKYPKYLNQLNILLRLLRIYTVTVHGSVCSFCVCLCGWTRSLCLSALPSTWRAIRTVTGVARLHCLYLAGVSVMRCQIVVFTLVVSLLSVSVFQVLRLFSRLIVFSISLKGADWTVFSARAGDSALPMIFAPPLCFGVCTCTASSSHLHCVLELSIKTICFSLAIGSRAFCTVTYTRISLFAYSHNHNTLYAIYKVRELLKYFYDTFLAFFGAWQSFSSFTIKGKEQPRHITGTSFCAQWQKIDDMLST